MLFISDAVAQTTNAAPNAGFSSFVPLILILIIFYFLLIRPQQKKAKKHQEMVNNLKIGNEICTNSGIFGFIKEIDSAAGTIDLEIAKNVVIKVLRFSVSELVKKEDKNSKKEIVVKKTSNKKTKTTKTKK